MEERGGGGVKSAKSEPVLLNVYDLNKKINKYTGKLGLGLYHSGVQACTSEGVVPETQDGFTGNDTFGTMLFKKTIVVGHTNFTKAEVDEILEEMSSEWRGRNYHLTRKNCNHFSNDFSRRLGTRGIPSFINRPARVHTRITTFLSALGVRSKD